MAFQGNYAFNGNYNGVNIYNIANPAAPALVTSIVCPGSQNDVSVYKNLLFVSVEATAREEGLHARRRPPTPQTRFRGIRIFDISDINNPVQVDGVQTCRGSHTHTLVRPKNDPNNVYIYVSGHGGRPLRPRRSRPATRAAIRRPRTRPCGGSRSSRSRWPLRALPRS